MKNLPLADKESFLRWSKLYFVALGILALMTAYINPTPPLTPRQRFELKKEQDKKLIELIECCHISDVYSFDKDYTATTYSPKSISYDFETQQFYLTQDFKSTKTEVNVMDLVTKSVRSKGIVESNLLYVYSDNQKVTLISKPNQKIFTDQIGQDETENLKKLVPRYKAVYFSKTNDNKEILVVDEENQLHFINQNLQSSKSSVKLSGLEQLNNLENFQIASFSKYFLILEMNTSNIHVFDKIKGSFIKTVNIEEVSKFASRGVELGQDKDTLIHPNTIAANEYNNTIYVFGKGWNGIYTFSFRDGFLDNITE